LIIKNVPHEFDMQAWNRAEWLNMTDV